MSAGLLGRGLQALGKYGWKYTKGLGLLGAGAGVMLLDRMSGGSGDASSKGPVMGRDGEALSATPVSANPAVGGRSSTSSADINIPALDTPRTAKRVSNPTISTLNESVVRLTSIALAISDNLRDQQNILKSQLEAGADATRETALEGGSTTVGGGAAGIAAGAIAADGTQLNNAQDRLEDIEGGGGSTLGNLITGVLSGLGISSLLKNFFRTKNAAAEAAKRATVVSKATGLVSSARKFNKSPTGKIAGRTLGLLGAGVSAMDTAESVERGDVGGAVLNAGLTGLQFIGTGLAGAATAVIGAVAAPATIIGGLTKGAELEGRNAAQRTAQFEKDTGIKVNTRSNGPGIFSVFGATMPESTSLTIGSRTYSLDEAPQEVKDLFYYYSDPDSRYAERRAGANRIEANPEYYEKIIQDINSGKDIIDVSSDTSFKENERESRNKEKLGYDKPRTPAVGTTSAAAALEAAGGTREDLDKESKIPKPKSQPITQRGLDFSDLRGEPVDTSYYANRAKTPENITPDAFTMQQSKAMMPSRASFPTGPSSTSAPVGISSSGELTVGVVPDPTYLGLGDYSNQIYFEPMIRTAA